MVSDDIYVVTTKNVEGWSGDHLTTMMEYIKEVYSSDYEFFEHRGYDASAASGSTPCDLLDWWRDEPFTSGDRNLLIASSSIWGEGGCAEKHGEAAVVTIYDGMAGMAGPSADSDLIGDQPVTGWAAPMQVAAGLQELGHLFGASHEQGIADNHNSVNYTSPMLASYADNQAGSDNTCGRKIEHDGLNENRYVEGYSKCAVDNSNFNHQPDKIYTKNDVESI